jgi:hypothetical protein
MVQPIQGTAGFMGYLKELGQRGPLNTVATMGAAAGGPQYLRGGGINELQVNYTPPQVIQPHTAEKAGYYTEKAAEIAAPVAAGGQGAAALRRSGRADIPVA